MADFGLSFIDTDPRKIVVVERVSDVAPEYPVYAKTKCMKCESWCWLSKNSTFMVEKRKASPICLECASDGMLDDSIRLK